MKRFILLTVFALLVLLNGICMADTIYVDQSGGGNYKTIQEAINAAYVDDTVKVRPGVYHENVVIDKNLSLIGSGPNFTTIDASKNAITVNNNVSVTISAFTITGAESGIIFNNNIACNIKNCIIVGCGHTGIYGNKVSLTCTIVNNTIASNGNSGIYFYDGGNVININVIGNIISFNGTYGISLKECCGKFYINMTYNDVYSNSSGDYSGCSAGTGDISQNPKFIDQNTGNFVLKNDSPCINTGRPGASYNDPDGTRNDMGAYAGPDAAAFWPYIPGGPVITEISVTPTSVPKGSKITIKARGRVR